MCGGGDVVLQGGGSTAVRQCRQASLAPTAILLYRQRYRAREVLHGGNRSPLLAVWPATAGAAAGGSRSVSLMHSWLLCPSRMEDRHCLCVAVTAKHMCWAELNCWRCLYSCLTLGTDLPLVRTGVAGYTSFAARLGIMPLLLHRHPAACGRTGTAACVPAPSCLLRWARCNRSRGPGRDTWPGRWPGRHASDGTDARWRGWCRCPAAARRSGLSGRASRMLRQEVRGGGIGCNGGDARQSSSSTVKHRRRQLFSRTCLRYGWGTPSCCARGGGT